MTMTGARVLFLVGVVLGGVSCHIQLPDEALELCRKAALYRQRCLNVYILNQSHWPLRQVTLPRLSLPPHIATFCHDYSHFFASGASLIIILS